MTIDVEYAGHLRKARGLDIESMDLADGATAGDLMRQLSDQHEPLRAILRREDGRLSRAVLVLVGDDLAADPSGVTLREGQRVTLLPAISGG